MNKIILTILIIAVIFISSCATLDDSRKIIPKDVEVNNFEECAAAGNPVMESYPRQCRANDITFVEEIEDGIIPTIESDDIGPLGSYFSDEMISKGVEKIGQPIEGFDAYLLKRAFPGLVDEDFDNVDALLGIYKIADTELIFEQNPTGLIHSAAQTISEKGMETLMGNAAGRLDMDIIDEEDVDELIVALE